MQTRRMAFDVGCPCYGGGIFPLANFVCTGTRQRTCSDFRCLEPCVNNDSTRSHLGLTLASLERVNFAEGGRLSSFAFSMLILPVYPFLYVVQDIMRPELLSEYVRSR